MKMVGEWLVTVLVIGWLAENMVNGWRMVGEQGKSYGEFMVNLRVNHGETLA